MSTTILDPTVVGKLRQFGRRRFQLLTMRALCAAVVTLLVCMSIVALIDWYWVLTDQTRWGLSLAAYALTVVVVWTSSVRKLVHLPAQEEIATHVEHAQPELRENLLSAVELATDNPAAIHDSPVFRGLLQGKVAQQMARIRIPSLLPFRLVARWLFAALIIAGVVAFVLMQPDPRFRTLAARAMLPGANIERVSRIHVDILQPSPTSLTVAKDETVAVVVRIFGGDVDEVTLETFTADEKPQRQSMRARTETEFAANIHVTQHSVDYRILAGDAITRKHTITAKGRPRVLEFHKTYVYPEYSTLSPKTVVQDHGDIVVLEGTQADLQLQLDQQVSTAELRISSTTSEDVTTIPLTINDTGLWCGSVPVDQAAIYKVHLVSKETGFENIFSRAYEIRPVPDLIPRAGFVDQQETNLLLPPNDILALQGMAQDDLPVVSLVQEISINGLEWQAYPLEIGPSASDAVDSAATTDEGSALAATSHRVNSHWNWDLLDLNLKTGDQITTRLVATDLKGHRGESVPLRIVISAPDFDPKRHDSMEHKARLYDRFARLANVAEEHKQPALEIVKQLRDDSNKQPNQQRGDAQQALDRTNLAEFATKLQEAANGLFKDIQNVTRRMPPGADAYDLDLSGRVIARLALEHCNTPAWLLQASRHTQDSKLLKSDFDQLKAVFERSAADAKTAALHYQNLMTHNVMAAVASDMDALFRQQTLVVNSPTQNWTRLLRQETLIQKQLEVIEQLVQDQKHRVSGSSQSHLNSLQQWAIQRIDQLKHAMESEDRLPELQRLSQTLHRELRDRQRLDVLDGGLPERLNGARRDLDNRSASLVEPLSRMSTATQEENRLRIEAAAADDSAKATALKEQAQRFIAEIDLKLRGSLDQLRSRRSLTQSRQDGDPQSAADTGLTLRAVTSLINQQRQGEPQDSIVPTAFREIAPAYRLLEAGHDLRHVQRCLENLIQLERWGSQELAGKLDHPRQWDVINKGLEQAVTRLRQAGAPNELMSKIDQLRWSEPVREAGRKIAQRRWARENLISATSNLMDLHDNLLPLMAEVNALMAEARAIIANYAPTIPQMAQQAAEQVRELEQQTADVADAVEQPEDQPEDPQSPKPDAPEMADLQQQQQRINQQIDDLFEALVEDANSQNLLDDEQRERARDADDSIAMVQEPAKQMNEALQQAEDSPTSEQQAKELSEAAEQQEKTAQALEKVAEHFDRLDKNMDVAQTRAELRQFERETGIAREMDQKFEPADQLAELAQQDPTDLIKELEAELKRNPAMQEALSEITQNTIQEARNTLQDAAAKDQEIQRANERSDTQFQQKKKELAEDLRKLGQDASKLSRQMVAQANSASSQAKTPEAQKNFAKTQEKLNTAANAANSANEGELQADLADKLQQATEAIKEATDTLKAGKEQSAAGKNQEIHADDKTREKVRKDLENRRKKFIDQIKREADAVKRQAEGVQRQADQQVKNAENQVRQMDRQVQQAQNNLKRKPDDNNLKRAVEQAQARKADAQNKVEQAQAKRDETKQQTADAHTQRDDLNKFPQPALSDKNPAAQLAEAFAEEATKAADELNRKAEELAKKNDFGDELAPPKNQLASAADQQQKVKDTVQATADDIARAARHERRLEKEAAAQAMQQTADNVEQVANNEATTAKQQLDAAADAAPDPQPAAAKPGDAKPGEGEAGEGEAGEGQDNQPALAANQAVAESEQAIAAQADALTGILTPMQQAQAAAAAAQSEPSTGQPPGQPQGNQPPAAGQPPNGAQPPTGSAPANPGEAPGQQPGGEPQSFTPEQLETGRQLAQTLDELDRLQSQAQADAATAAAQPGQTPAQPTPGMTQAAQAQQAQMAAARALAQQQAALANNPTGFNPEGIPSYTGAMEEVLVVPVNRDENEEWGKLREKAAKDLTKGRTEAVSEEYRKSVETYFRVLAERARKKK